MSNPIDDLLDETPSTEKTANPSPGVWRQARDAAVGGLAMGAAGAALAGAAVGVQHLVDAATKSKDFRTMLTENHDLANHEDQKSVHMAFTTLRRFAPEFSKDPMVAGTYVRQMVENPMGAGGIVGQAMQHTRGESNPVMDSAMLGMQGGLRFKEPKDFLRKDLEHQKKVKDYDVEKQKEMEVFKQGLRPPRPPSPKRP